MFSLQLLAFNRSGQHLGRFKSRRCLFALEEEMSRSQLLVIALIAIIIALAVYYVSPQWASPPKPAFEIGNLEITSDSIAFNVSNVGKGDAHSVHVNVSFPINLGKGKEWIPLGGWTLSLIRAGESAPILLSMALPELVENKTKITISCGEGVQQEHTFDLP